MRAPMRWIVMPMVVAVLIAAIITACGGPLDVDGTDDGPGGSQPAAPRAVHASANGDAVLVTWEREDDGAAVHVYRAHVQVHGDVQVRSEFARIAEVASSVTMYEDREVLPHARYVYGISATVGDATTAIIEQEGPPVALGPGDDEPLAIVRFDATPDHGSGAVTVEFAWELRGSRDGWDCAIDFGDGEILHIPECASVEATHAYASAASGVVVAELRVVRGPDVIRARHGIALNLNPDEQRFLSLVVRQEDGMAVAGKATFFGNVSVIAIDRNGDYGYFDSDLDENGQAVFAEYEDGPIDLTPYTLIVVVQTAEEYEGILTKFRGVDGPGTLYLQSESEDLARLQLGTVLDGDVIGSAMVVVESVPWNGDRPLIACCLYPSNTGLFHVDPDSYTMLFAGLTHDGKAFYVSDHIDVGGDIQYDLDARSRPHGSATFLATTADGQRVDHAWKYLSLSDAPFWPGYSPNQVWLPQITFIQNDALLLPGTYLGLLELHHDGWSAYVNIPSIDIVRGAASTVAVGGTWQASLRVFEVGEGLVPGGGFTVAASVSDAHGNDLIEVALEEGGNVQRHVRITDPEGSVFFDGPSDQNGLYLALPEGSLPGEYHAEFAWDIGPFSDGRLLAGTTFVVLEGR